MTVPECQGEAAFASKAQAEYVAGEAAAEFDSIFVAVECGDHWHVREA
jgi:hypothetical protein